MFQLKFHIAVSCVMSVQFQLHVKQVSAPAGPARIAGHNHKILI